MLGKTPPLAIVTLPRSLLNSSSFLTASWMCLGTIRVFLLSLAAFPASSNTYDHISITWNQTQETITSNWLDVYILLHHMDQIQSKSTLTLNQFQANHKHYFISLWFVIEIKTNAIDTGTHMVTQRCKNQKVIELLVLYQTSDSQFSILITQFKSKSTKQRSSNHLIAIEIQNQGNKEIKIKKSEDSRLFVTSAARYSRTAER